MVGQAITDPISGPSFDFTFTIGPELDNTDDLGYCEYATPFQLIRLLNSSSI